jgi:integration host factor subunit alpha
MTKVNIIDTIREKVGFTKADTARIVESVFDIIKETLQREDKIVISGFGNFVARKKAARQGRNPKTGSDVEISPRRVLTFKPSPMLRSEGRSKCETGGGVKL